MSLVDLAVYQNGGDGGGLEEEFLLLVPIRGHGERVR